MDKDILFEECYVEENSNGISICSTGDVCGLGCNAPGSHCGIGCDGRSCGTLC